MFSSLVLFFPRFSGQSSRLFDDRFSLSSSRTVHTNTQHTDLKQQTNKAKQSSFSLSLSLSLLFFAHLSKRSHISSLSFLSFSPVVFDCNWISHSRSYCRWCTIDYLYIQVWRIWKESIDDDDDDDDGGDDVVEIEPKRRSFPRYFKLLLQFFSSLFLYMFCFFSLCLFSFCVCMPISKTKESYDQRPTHKSTHRPEINIL